MNSQPKPDTPGLLVLPPVFWAGGFILGYVLHRLLPVFSLHLTGGAAIAVRVAGWTIIGAGVGIGFPAVVAFRRAGTPPDPRKPATVFVTHGPYRLTRNPMYVGFTAIYIGASLLLHALWPLVLLPPVLVAARGQVIEKEERYLERTFGEPYRDYRRRVRRWL